MAKFNFRLQTLLKLRTVARDQCRASLAEAYQAEQILRQKTAQLAVELAELKRQIRGQTEPGRVNVDSLLNTHRYELILLAQQQQLEEQAKQIDDEIRRRRTLLVEADKQVRVLQKLRQRRESQHEFVQSQQQNKEMDEVAARCVRRGLTEDIDETATDCAETQ